MTLRKVSLIYFSYYLCIVIYAYAFRPTISSREAWYVSNRIDKWSTNEEFLSIDSIRGIDNSLLSLGHGPGETEAKPSILVDSSRREVMRLVVSLSILWLTIAVKVEDAVARLQSTKNTKFDRNVIEKGDGGQIEIYDVCVGEDFEEGTSLILTAALFYNGYKCSEGNFQKILKTSRAGQLSERELASLPLPAPGLYRALHGMKGGGVRRVILPPSEAFGPQGLAPFIPPSSTVTYELSLTKV